MNLEVSLSKKAAEWLEQRAQAVGTDQASIAARVLEEVAENDLRSNGPENGNGTVGSGHDLDLLLNEFFAQNPSKLPSLPTDFSRRDIYADHD